MKKIFTLIICLMGMTVVANATDITPVENCIQYLLANHNNSQTLRANDMNASMDANHDGVINIQDVTTMINEMLRAQQANRAPEADIHEMIQQALKSDTGTPNIDDVTDAIEKKLQNK